MKSEMIVKSKNFDASNSPFAFVFGTARSLDFCIYSNVRILRFVELTALPVLRNRKSYVNAFENGLFLIVNLDLFFKLCAVDGFCSADKRENKNQDQSRLKNLFIFSYSQLNYVIFEKSIENDDLCRCSISYLRLDFNR